MALIQDIVPNIESILSIKDVSIIGVFLLIIIYLAWDNRSLKKRVEKVIDAHQEDLKEANNDLKAILEKNHEFARELREIVRSK